MNNFQGTESFGSAGVNLTLSSCYREKCNEEESISKRQKTNTIVKCDRFVSHVTWKESDVFVSYSNEVRQGRMNEGSVRICKVGSQYAIVLNVAKK